MERIGFHIYYRWNADQLADYLTAHGFQVIEQACIGSSLAPLCYAAAVKKGCTMS